jgi:histidinol-phosphate aminotransferase
MHKALVHGGTDALGVPAHDFSTNRNACGPCPQAVAALAEVHVAQYPDPHYTDVRAQLAAWHGVPARRVVVAGSASEFIHRITAHAVRSGAQQVTVPTHSYGDYPHAASVWGLPLPPRASHAAAAGLHWACEPSSPCGWAEDVAPLWAQPLTAQTWRVLDCAYAPLRLHGAPSHGLTMDEVWQLWTPNKALGMTGVRAAYAIAPADVSDAELATLRALAPSWVVGAHGVAMLQAWTSAAVQNWLQQSLCTLRQWQAQQLALCADLGWHVLPGHQANYWVARWPDALHGAPMAQRLQDLRTQGIKLRDCASFGLPGHVRMGVLPPASQQALRQAWRAW